MGNTWSADGNNIDNPNNTVVMSIKSEYTKYVLYREKAEASFLNLQDLINEKSEFKIYLNDFPADGLCVMCEETAVGMMIGSVMEIIKDKGKLTKEDWAPIY